MNTVVARCRVSSQGEDQHRRRQNQQQQHPTASSDHHTMAIVNYQRSSSRRRSATVLAVAMLLVVQQSLLVVVAVPVAPSKQELPVRLHDDDRLTSSAADADAIVYDIVVGGGRHAPSGYSSWTFDVDAGNSPSSSAADADFRSGDYGVQVFPPRSYDVSWQQALQDAAAGRRHVKRQFGMGTQQQSALLGTSAAGIAYDAYMKLLHEHEQRKHGDRSVNPVSFLGRRR